MPCWERLLCRLSVSELQTDSLTKSISCLTIAHRRLPFIILCRHATEQVLNAFKERIGFSKLKKGSIVLKRPVYLESQRYAMTRFMVT